MNDPFTDQFWGLEAGGEGSPAEDKGQGMATVQSPLPTRKELENMEGAGRGLDPLQPFYRDPRQPYSDLYRPNRSHRSVRSVCL